MRGEQDVVLSVNGHDRKVRVTAPETLLQTLRALGLTSVRETCGIGICGTCTVLREGRAISSCLALTAMQEGRPIVTSEAFDDGSGELDEVARAFRDRSAFQCSYCIPAMVLTVRAYLDESEDPTPEEAREVLAGNLCRCGTYPQILEAVADLVARRSDR
ncbi:MAG TPA: 2Fe-2S iron-sulfur cluster-binding protein [Actinomycetota bacterium]|nr:2Fe-2S iron-sulfur cluster-binding protein [Actinomycetota bacterium]